MPVLLPMRGGAFWKEIHCTTPLLMFPVPKTETSGSGVCHSLTQLHTGDESSHGVFPAGKAVGCYFKSNLASSALSSEGKRCFLHKVIEGQKEINAVSGQVIKEDAF